MIRYRCDGCGATLKPNDSRRFIVRIEVYAAAGHVDLDAEDHQPGALEEVLSELARADPDEIEDQTYRSLRFDVCDSCRRALLKRPLGAARPG